jgi:hypothetical protein
MSDQGKLMRSSAVGAAAARIVAGFLAGVALLALAGSPSRIAASPLTLMEVVPVPSPAGANSSEPQLTVQGNRVILSWLEVAGSRATLKFAEYTKTGWSAAHAVHAGPDFFINSYDVPSVRALADGSLVAHWMDTNGPSDDASKIFLSWSKDNGHTWTKGVTPHTDGTPTEHGFASLFQAPGAGNGVGLIWIDGRATDPEKETGDMSLRASSYSPSGKQLVGEDIIAPRVCECCSTAAAETSDGIIVAFRGRSATEVRDIYVSSLAAGKWSAPALVHDDEWIINACPINGPAISAAGRDVAVAWFVAKNDQGRAFVAFSHDAGHTFGPPVRVDDVSSLGRLGVQMLADGSAAVTWIEFSKNHSQMRVRKVAPNGARSAALIVAETSGGRYPRMARAGDDLVFAWTDVTNGASKVRTARMTANWR